MNDSPRAARVYAGVLALAFAAVPAHSWATSSALAEWHPRHAFAADTVRVQLLLRYFPGDGEAITRAAMTVAGPVERVIGRTSSLGGTIAERAPSELGVIYRANPIAQVAVDSLDLMLIRAEPGHVEAMVEVASSTGAVFAVGTVTPEDLVLDLKAPLDVTGSAVPHIVFAEEDTISFIVSLANGEPSGGRIVDRWIVRPPPELRIFESRLPERARALEGDAFEVRPEVPVVPGGGDQVVWLGSVAPEVEGEGLWRLEAGVPGLPTASVTAEGPEALFVRIAPSPSLVLAPPELEAGSRGTMTLTVTHETAVPLSEMRLTLGLPAGLAAVDTFFAENGVSGVTVELGADELLMAFSEPLEPGEAVEVRLVLRASESAEAQLAFTAIFNFALPLDASDKTRIVTLALDELGLTVSQPPLLFALDRTVFRPLNDEAVQIVYGGAVQQWTAIVYSLAGDHVARFERPRAEPIQWDGRDDAGAFVPSGVYVLVLEAGGTSALRKVGVVK